MIASLGLLALSLMIILAVFARYDDEAEYREAEKRWMLKALEGGRK
jgi:hypothetical protein